MIVSEPLIAYIPNFALHELFGGESSWRFMLVLATVPVAILFNSIGNLISLPSLYAPKIF